MTSEAPSVAPAPDVGEARDVDLEATWRALIEEHAGLITRAIVRICPRNLGIQLDDLEQEVRFRLWRAVHNERIFTHPASYIHRTAVTATLDAVRSAKARREEALPADLVSRAESATEIVARRATMERVQRALNRMPKNRRRAVLLHLRGLTINEVAKLCGWTQFRARNLVYRGLKQLRRSLREEGIELEAD